LLLIKIIILFIKQLSGKASIKALIKSIDQIVTEIAYLVH